MILGPLYQEGAVCAPRRLGEFFEPILFFLCQKEKNGFNLPRKERGQGAYRCPEFDSKNLSHQLSVTPDPTSRKVSALCASPFGRAAQQNRRLRTDRVVRPYRMLRIRKKPLARHHQDSVRRGVRRSQLHCASAGAAKAPYSLAPSSFPNCDRCAGSQFGDTRALPVLGLLFPFLHRARRFFSFSKKRKKRMGAQKHYIVCPQKSVEC